MTHAKWKRKEDFLLLLRTSNVTLIWGQIWKSFSSILVSSGRIKSWQVLTDHIKGFMFPVKEMAGDLYFQIAQFC